MIKMIFTLGLIFKVQKVHEDKSPPILVAVRVQARCPIFDKFFFIDSKKTSTYNPTLY